MFIRNKILLNVPLRNKYTAFEYINITRVSPVRFRSCLV